MLIYINLNETLALSYEYFYVYNMTLIMFFWVLQQFISFNFNTLYSFNDLKFNSFYITTLTICLFSMAGIPPFLGFFTKLLLLINLINSQFFIFFIFFFILLFFGLYFYLQNLRFLYSTSQKFQNKLNYGYEINTRQPIFFGYFVVFLGAALSFGFLFFDDLSLYFAWLFV